MSLFCESCGKENKEISKFCNGCGGSLENSLPYKSLQVGTVLEERYQIMVQLVSGEISALYKAKVLKLNSICAVKELIPSKKILVDRVNAVEWFKREARLLARMDHPNLPKVFDYFVLNERYYLIMNFIEGEDLHSILEKRGNPGLPEDVVINWSKQILQVLDYLHNLNPPVVYRDIKPENIMLHKDGRLMLIDFGIARVVRIDIDDAPKTVIGTDGYAPLEQYQGRPEPRSDIYALGATMHHLLSGIVPAPLGIESVRESVPHVSERLDHIIMKALQEKPEDRFSSAKEMLEALNRKQKIDSTVNFGVLYRDMLFGKGFRSINFIDTDNGWAVGNNGKIINTVNGGDSWKEQSSSVSSALYGVHFADHNTGWAVGDKGTILSTKNGGENWKIQKSPTKSSLYDVHFIDSDTGWAVGEDGTVLKLSGGSGKAWFPLKGAGENWELQKTGTLSVLYSIYFIDMDRGWAVGGGIILYTTDGGNKWNEVKIEKSLMSVFFADMDNGWIVGDFGIILHSGDGGITWNEQSEESPVYLVDVYFVDKKNGWAVGGNPETGETILHTSDGGSTWIERKTGIGKPLAGVHFVNVNSGWVIGYNGAILQTMNGGVTWNAQNSRALEDLMDKKRR